MAFTVRDLLSRAHAARHLMHGRASPTPDQVPGTIAPARGRATLTARTLPSAPLAGDVIQFDRVTKTYHAGSPPALAPLPARRMKTAWPA